MKRLMISLAALIVSAACFNAGAEGFLVKGGFSYTHLDLTQSVKDQAKALGADVRNYSGFHAGIGYQTESFGGFTLQPEFMFLSRKGSNFGDKSSWSMNYLELPVNVQWGIDLVALRPFVQASPYVGYSIRNSIKAPEGNVKGFLEHVREGAKRFSYGLGIGGGVELMRKFQISAQYVWNFGQVLNAQEYINNATNVSRDTAAGLELSIALMF
ncbi:MAG: PorT family protein [Bacteroidales bacterium]|nr:PorT family protein [Bacteroidales bacterium]